MNMHMALHLRDALTGCMCQGKREGGDSSASKTALTQRYNDSMST